MQRLKWSGNSHDSWFMICPSRFFSIPLIAIQHQELPVCSLHWWALMWRIGGEIRDRPKNTLRFRNWYAHNNSSDIFSKNCFDASTASRFELTLVDPLIKQKNWFVWYKTWNSVAELSKVQTALFLVFTQIKRTFLVRRILFSFIKESTNENKTAACFCGGSIEYYCHAPNFHTGIVLGMHKLNF